MSFTKESLLSALKPANKKNKAASKFTTPVAAERTTQNISLVKRDRFTLPHTPTLPDSTRFALRKDKDKTILNLNSIPFQQNTVQTQEPKISIYDPININKYLQRSLVATGDYYENLLLFFKENAFGTLEFTNSPSFLINETVTCLADAKLNPTSVILETSRELNSAIKISLDLTKLLANSTPIRLFPGQIVAVEGEMLIDNILDVSKIIYPITPEVPLTPLNELKSFYKKPDPQTDLNPTQMMLCCGPFTLDDNLSFEPFEQFTLNVAQVKPDVIVLMGPFVPFNHKCVAEGEVDVTLEELFRNEISSRIHRMIEARPHTKVIMIPSTFDACHHFGVFPQPAFCSSGNDGKEQIRMKEELDLNNDRILLFSNPCVFSINEVVFACSTFDVIKEISANEVSINEDLAADNIEGGRIVSLYRNIIEQRQFVPLSPSKIDSTTQPKLLKCDVLIVPSVLKPTLGTVGKTVCLNPGFLARGMMGGNFCRMSVFPMDFDDDVMDTEDGEEDVVFGASHFSDRTAVEIVKI